MSPFLYFLLLIMYESPFLKYKNKNSMICTFANKRKAQNIPNIKTVQIPTISFVSLFLSRPFESLLVRQGFQRTFCYGPIRLDDI